MTDRIQFKEEVKELTNLFRTEWEDIREIADRLNLDFDKTYLLGFVESEDESESGLFYTDRRELIRFERTPDCFNVEIVSKDGIQEAFPQVIVLDEIEDFENW